MPVEYPFLGRPTKHPPKPPRNPYAAGQARGPKTIRPHHGQCRCCGGKRR